MSTTKYYTFQLHTGGAWNVARDGIVISEWKERKDAKRVAELLERENAELCAEIAAKDTYATLQHEERMRLEAEIERLRLPTSRSDMQGLVDGLRAEIKRMRPVIDACKARYERHKAEAVPDEVEAPCVCLTCQWYQDYESKAKP